MSRQVARANTVPAQETKVRIKAAVTAEESANNSSALCIAPDVTTYTDANGVQMNPYVFAKTLDHDSATSLPLKNSVDTLMNALNKGTKESVDAIARTAGTTRKLEGVLAHHSINLMGSASVTPRTRDLYPITSAESAFEMAEVYAKSLSREINFDEWDTNANIAELVVELNKYSSKTTAPTSSGVITPGTLFRGPGVGELAGPYISQCLIKDFKYGNLEIVQKFLVETPPKYPNDHATHANQFTSKDAAEYHRIATGAPLSAGVQTDGSRHINNAMVLGSLVHNDPLYQLYYNAALVCLQSGFGLENGGGVSPNTSAWTSGGGPDLLANVAHVAKGALLVGWEHKWGQTRIRPEAYANLMRLSEDANLKASIPGLAAMKDAMDVSNILTLTKAQDNGAGAASNNSLLLLQFPEGSPIHPSFPAGHATVAGACTTVLKCFFRTHMGTDAVEWAAASAQQVDTDASGATSLNTYAGGATLTLVGELNKLASNVALGRDWAGVHYRADGDLGLELGEQYAMDYMVNVCQSYNEPLSYHLQKFNGDFVTISADGVKSQ